MSSCISRVEKYGYMFDLADHATIKAEVTSKERLINMMGSPSFVSYINNDEVWVYYSHDVKKLLFFKPTIIARNVMVIEFDNKEQVVKKIEKFDLSDGSNLSFSSKFTEVKSDEAGIFKSLFGNIGKVTPQ